MKTGKWRGLADELAEALVPDRELADLARVVYDVVGRHVPFDFACLAAMDPATGVITWTSKTRSIGTGDEEFAAAEYGAPDVNQFAELATRRPPVGALAIDTDGEVDRCRRFRDFLAPRFGFTDELRVVFIDRSVAWGGLAMYRVAGDPPFSAAEAAQLAATSEMCASAVARSLFRRAPIHPPRPASDAGPAILICDIDGAITHLSPAVETIVEDLGGWDHGSLPAAVLAAVAATRTGGIPTDTRIQGRDGRWWSLRAAPLAGPTGRQDVVVSVEATPRGALHRFALAAHGLTNREEEVAVLVLQGASTKDIAGSLHLSPHTVQDHLKKIFEKVGVSSRRDLIVRLALD